MTEQTKQNQTTVMENEHLEEENLYAENDTENNLQEDNQITQLEQMNEELKNKLIRAQADFDNYKKRTRIEKEEFAKYASVKLIEALLPAYDNFERAIASSKENQNFESLIQGVEMVYRQIDQTLNQEGLQVIETVGQRFDPQFHQAVMQVETDEFESGVVVEELQKGYKLKDKVIRPAMVKVNA